MGPISFFMGWRVLGRIRNSILTGCVFVLVDSATGGDDLGFSKWVEEVQGKPGLWVS